MSFEQPSSDFFAAKDYNGHLVLIENYGAPYHTTTNYGDSEVVKADVTVLTHPEGPKTFRQTQVFGAALVGAISRGTPGGRILGRIGQGQPKAGQSAPWVLNPFEPQDAAAAQAFVDSRAAAGFGQPQAAPAPAAPQMPVAPVAPVAPVTPVAPAVPQVPMPVAPAVAAPAPVAPVAPGPVAAAPAPAAQAVDVSSITPEQWAALPPHVQQALAAQAAAGQPPF